MLLYYYNTLCWLLLKLKLGDFVAGYTACHWCCCYYCKRSSFTDTGLLTSAFAGFSNVTLFRESVHLYISKISSDAYSSSPFLALSLLVILLFTFPLKIFPEQKRETCKKNGGGGVVSHRAFFCLPVTAGTKQTELQLFSSFFPFLRENGLLVIKIAVPLVAI